MSKPENPGLELAIEKAGGITALARLLNVKSHGVVHQWRIARVPAEHCLEIERHTGVTCEQLRPDLAWEVVRGIAQKRKPKAVA